MTSKNKMIARIGVGVVALALLGCIGYLAFNLDQQKKENKEMQALAELDKTEMENEYQQFAN